MKQLVLINGGDSFPTREAFFAYWRAWQVENPFTEVKRNKWRKWLAEELLDTFLSADLRMPNSMKAQYDEWEMWFEKYVPFFEDGVVLVGHSLGANFLAKYLEENSPPVHIGQLHLVSGCYGENNFTLPDTLPNVGSQCDHICIYHSTDDPLVPFTDAEKFKKALPSAELVTFKDRGHFLVPEFPELAQRIRMS